MHSGGIADETIRHMVYGCKWAKEVRNIVFTEWWGRREFFFWPVLTTPPDKDLKTVCDKKVEQPLRGFLSKTTLQKAVGMFLLTTHTLGKGGR